MTTTNKPILVLVCMLLAWIDVLSLCGCHSVENNTGATVFAAADQLTLSWQNNATNADGIQVQRRTGTNGELTTIYTVGANATSYADKNVKAATNYCYRVGAFNSAGVGWSDVVCATSPATAAVDSGLTTPDTTTAPPTGADANTPPLQKPEGGALQEPDGGASDPAQVDAAGPAATKDDADVTAVQGSGDLSCRITKEDDGTSRTVCDVDGLAGGCAIASAPAGLPPALVAVLLMLLCWRRRRRAISVSRN